MNISVIRRYLAKREVVLMLVWGCIAHLLVMLAEVVPRWTPLWPVRILALETALCFPLTFRVSAACGCAWRVNSQQLSMSWQRNRCSCCLTGH
jgi:hypothetical protein